MTDDKPVCSTLLKWYRYGDHKPPLGRKVLVHRYGGNEPFTACQIKANRDSSFWWTSSNGTGYRRCDPDDLWAVVEKPTVGKWDLSQSVSVVDENEVARQANKALHFGERYSQQQQTKETGQ